MKHGTVYRCPRCPDKSYYGLYVAQHAIKKKAPVRCENCSAEMVPVGK